MLGSDRVSGGVRNSGYFPTMFNGFRRDAFNFADSFECMQCTYVTELQVTNVIELQVLQPFSFLSLSFSSCIVVVVTLQQYDKVVQSFRQESMIYADLMHPNSDWFLFARNYCNPLSLSLPKYLLSFRSLGVYFYVLDAFLKKKLRLLSRTPPTLHVCEFCEKLCLYF